MKDFANQTMTNAAASRSVLPSLGYSDEQNDHTQALLAYRHKYRHPCTIGSLALVCISISTNLPSIIEVGQYTNLYLFLIKVSLFPGQLELKFQIQMTVFFSRNIC